MTTATIPNRPVFRAQEVCDLAGVEAYVLRSWETEFPDLGVSKSGASPRVYRRADVERVLRIKQLVYVDGLTLAGARRRLSEEGVIAPDEPLNDSDVASMLNDATRQELRNVRRGLHWILGVLSGDGVKPEDFVLSAPAPASRARPVEKSRPVKARASRPVAKKQGKKKR